MPLARIVIASLFMIAFVGPGCKKAKPTERESADRSPESPKSTSRERIVDPAATAQLGDEVEIEGYRIRPPRGYRSLKMPNGPAAMRGGSWAGSPRADGSSPTLLFLLATIPVGERLPAGEAGLAEFMSGIRKRRTDWSEIPPETCQIGGLRFFRAEWRGKEATSGRPMHGFLYFAVDGRTVIQLSSQDFEPYDQKSLPVGEAGALTFRKLTQSPSP